VPGSGGLERRFQRWPNAEGRGGVFQGVHARRAGTAGAIKCASIVQYSKGHVKQRTFGASTLKNLKTLICEFDRIHFIPFCRLSLSKPASAQLPATVASES
jgi:hypothetical protein